VPPRSYALPSNSHSPRWPLSSGCSNGSASTLDASSVIRCCFRTTSSFERRVPKNFTSNKFSIRTSSRSVPESRRCGQVPRTLVPHSVSHARQPAWAPYGDYFGPCHMRTVFARQASRATYRRNARFDRPEHRRLLGSPCVVLERTGPKFPVVNVGNLAKRKPAWSHSAARPGAI
jgi:hypothetical protein